MRVFKSNTLHSIEGVEYRLALTSGHATCKSLFLTVENMKIKTKGI